MKRICIGSLVVLGTLIVGLATAAAVAFRGGISARVEPTRLESWVARRVRGWAIPGSARSAPNPIPASPGVLADGRAHFAEHCAGCHANDGSGRTEGRSMYPPAPDMRGGETQKLADGELFYIIENGIRFTGMPGWGGAGRPEESWKLVHFIRYLPRMTPEEIAEMERLNPRSAHEWRELQEEEEFLRGGETGKAAPHRGH